MLQPTAAPARESPSRDKPFVSVRRASRPLRALEARVRRTDRDAEARYRRGPRADARVQAQAQFVRPRRGHRARRCPAAHPLRASGSEERGRHQRQGAHLLLRREHLHARALQPRVEGQLLQVHQRDAQRDRGFEPPFGAQVHRRLQRHHGGRRVRAGARLRRDRPDRRPLVRGQPARGAAARRAARHRRPDARDRQAPRAPRPRRHLLHAGRGRARRAGEGLAPDRRFRQAAAVRGQGEGARRRPRCDERPAADRAAASRSPRSSGPSTTPATTTGTSTCRSIASRATRRSRCRRPPDPSRRTLPPSKRRALPGGRWLWRASWTTRFCCCAPTSSRSARGS